jgi:hypothetical protein
MVVFTTGFMLWGKNGNPDKENNQTLFGCGVVIVIASVLWLHTLMPNRGSAQKYTPRMVLASAAVQQLPVPGEPSAPPCPIGMREPVASDYTLAR